MTDWLMFFGQVAWRIVKWPPQVLDSERDADYFFRLYGWITMTLSAFAALSLSRLSTFQVLLSLPVAGVSLRAVNPALDAAIFAAVLLVAVAALVPLVALFLVHAAMQIIRAVGWVLWGIVLLVARLLGWRKATQKDVTAAFVGSVFALLGILFLVYGSSHTDTGLAAAYREVIEKHVDEEVSSSHKA